MNLCLRNSNDKTFPIGFCCGTRTFVCDNLAFSSEIVISKRHTRFGRDRFVEGIAHAVRNLDEYQSAERQRIETLQQRTLRDDVADAMILRSAEQDIMGWRLIPKVLGIELARKGTDMCGCCTFDLDFTVPVHKKRKGNIGQCVLLKVRVGAYSVERTVRVVSNAHSKQFIICAG